MLSASACADERADAEPSDPIPQFGLCDSDDECESANECIYVPELGEQMCTSSCVDGDDDAQPGDCLGNARCGSGCCFITNESRTGTCLPTPPPNDGAGDGGGDAGSDGADGYDVEQECTFPYEASDCLCGNACGSDPASPRYGLCSRCGPNGEGCVSDDIFCCNDADCPAPWRCTTLTPLPDEGYHVCALLDPCSDDTDCLLDELCEDGYCRDAS